MQNHETYKTETHRTHLYSTGLDNLLSIFLGKVILEVGPGMALCHCGYARETVYGNICRRWDAWLWLESFNYTPSV